MHPPNNSLCALVKKVEIAKESGDINLALRSIHDFVERIITEPLCTAKVFSSRALDQLCLAIGRESLAALEANIHGQPKPRVLETGSVVYIVSRLQRSGGHSRLVQDFIRAQPTKRHLILSTEVGGPTDIDYFSRIYSGSKDTRIERAPRGNLSARLTWLQTRLLANRPEHIYLFNHHQDSVAVAALIPELNLTGSFCHHGDHHLCLGVHCDHLTHLDFHPMGFHHCRSELGIANQYLPLTFEDKQCVPLNTDFMQGGRLTTATAARSNKVEIPYYVSYLDVIPRILKATGGKHVHIGKLTPWAKYRIRRQLRKLNVPEEQFIYLEWTSSVWQSLQTNMVDVYVASFPYGAGLTLIEAMGAGIPVILHQHMDSRVLSGLELAYPEAFRWSNPDELINHLVAIQPTALESERVLARSRYEAFHQSKLLHAHFDASTPVQTPVPPLAPGFTPRTDEWAAWVESQTSFSRHIHRLAYRGFRKIRRAVS